VNEVWVWNNHKKELVKVDFGKIETLETALTQFDKKQFEFETDDVNSLLNFFKMFPIKVTIKEAKVKASF